jgi:uncharacterized RDD family membrane protein YckC
MQQAPPAAPTTVQLAPLTLRLLAIGLDLIIQVAIILVIASIMQTAGIVHLDELQEEQQQELALPDTKLLAAWLIFSASYHIGFVAAKGATPGKMAAGIYVADLQGRAVTPDTAILRYLVYLVGGAVSVGTIASALLLFTDRERRTVHDRIARTVVLRRPNDDDTRR